MFGFRVEVRVGASDMVRVGLILWLRLVRVGARFRFGTLVRVGASTMVRFGVKIMVRVGLRLG